MVRSCLFVSAAGRVHRVVWLAPTGSRPGRLLGSRGVRAVPAMIRDLDGIASVFLTALAGDAAKVVREGGVK